MHPFKPETAGQYLGDFQDACGTYADGTYVYRRIIEVARSTGDGFVDYVWIRPASTDHLPERCHIATYTP
jgi:methyl-accepting chemotaxis protein